MAEKILKKGAESAKTFLKKRMIRLPICECLQDGGKMDINMNSKKTAGMTAEWRGCERSSHDFGETQLCIFRQKLLEEEKCRATVEKYVRDVRELYAYAGKNRTIDKELVIAYKQRLMQQYAVVTVNGKLASLNSFFKKMDRYDCVVKSVKVQREAFRLQDRELTKPEYFRLLEAARKEGNHRLYLIMETSCATGIRVSELPFITVESLCTRRSRVSLKGKTRTVILPVTLCRKLKQYVREGKIRKGSVFVTRNGRPLDRSNIFREMKALCAAAGVEARKVFPHNLRHLFACTYYQEEKDIAHLADVLGHSSVNTTRIYLMKSSEEQEKQIEHLGLVL